MKKFILWLLVICAIFCFFKDEITEHLVPILEELDIPAFGIVDHGERLDSLPEEYYDNPYVESRKGGDCRTFTGDVLITVIMVDDDGGVWTEADMETAKAEQEKYVAMLHGDAADYGADLRISVQYMECAVTGSVSIEEKDEWTAAALDALGIPSDGEANEYLKEEYGVDEAPIMFWVNYEGRAFATQRSGGGGAEYAYLFADDADLRHELLHLFGAEDFYYPEEVEEIGEKYFPDSVMLTKDNCSVDSLTAYLIGWTDAPDETGEQFLADTNHLTEEYLSAEGDKQSKSGYGSRRISDGVYTGDMLDGVPHGNGEMVWDSGNRYTGEWSHGRLDGYGSHVWTDGSIYVGNWADGVQQGFGRMSYSDGKIYEGEWQSGQPWGQGKLTYTDGKTYEGGWSDGEPDGYGKVTFPDGDGYEGQWNMGEYIG